MYVDEMTRTHPQPPVFADDALARCIEECFACAQACTACADACLAEADPRPLARCIRLNLDCADVCVTAGRMLSRQLQPELELVRRQIELCALACRACGDECDQHAATHAHCRVCKEACRRCEQACLVLGGGRPTAAPGPGPH